MAPPARVSGFSSARLWQTLCNIAYELRPFSPPDITTWGTSARHAAVSTIGMAKYLWTTSVKAASAVSAGQWMMASAWTGGWLLTIKLGFGSIYFICGMMAGVFLNLREAAPGEASAYSVFNDGFRRLMGTMDVAQFERELLHQPLRGNADDDEEDEGFVLLDGGGEAARLNRHRNVAARRRG